MAWQITDSTKDVGILRAQLYGPGVGKTQLALEYARRQCFDSLSPFWTDSDQKDMVTTNLVRCVEHITNHYRIQGLTRSPHLNVLGLRHGTYSHVLRLLDCAY